MKKKYLMNLQLFTDDAYAIDRTDAGALIPEEHINEIVEGAIEQSTVLSFGRRLPDMGAKVANLPVLDSLPIAYFVNGDAGQKKTTKEAWDKKVITAEEIAVIVPISENVLDDSNYDIWGQVKPRIIEAFGQVIDAAILFGTNKPTSWPSGIVTGATAAGNTVTIGTDLYDDLLSTGGVISKVEESGFFVSGHVADITMRAALRSVKATTGEPIFKADMQGGTNYSLDGSPINFSRNGAWDPTAALMISGDWSQLVYSIRKDITFKIFTDGIVQNTDGSIAYNLMQNDMVALRAVMRLGWQLPNPINQIKKNKTYRYPFSVLLPSS